MSYSGPPPRVPSDTQCAIPKRLRLERSNVRETGEHRVHERPRTPRDRHTACIKDPGRIDAGRIKMHRESVPRDARLHAGTCQQRRSGTLEDE